MYSTLISSMTKRCSSLPKIRPTAPPSTDNSRFSRRLGQREAENNAYLALLAKARHSRQAAKERRAQRKDFCFFKCPGCGTMLRVPRGKGKIHIKCRCGYTLYRKT